MEATQRKTSRKCRAQKSAGRGRSWACTRPAGHAGRHAAHDLNGTAVARWAKR